MADSRVYLNLCYSQYETDAGEETNKDLECPVCLGTFTDPLYVCASHHTLCRPCYERLLREASTCPICRSQLSTKPLQNSTMERLISSSHLIPQEGATCRWKDEAGQCTIPVFVKCRHCDRRLCSRHFSIHWMQFEADCTNLVDRVQQQTAEADRVNASLQPWNSLIVGLIEFLDMEKKRLQDLLNSATPKADWAALAVRKRAEAAALQAALASDDQRAARAKFDQLRGLVEASKATFGLENVGPPPTDEQRREIDKAKSAIDTIVGTMVGTCGGIDDLIGVYDDEFDVYAVCEVYDKNESDIFTTVCRCYVLKTSMSIASR
uniref:RING-type domain-containing protein n=1 Tax=Macrostomum lignano TaxID=282301 RepID=A0A1I8H1U5_9PLAT